MANVYLRSMYVSPIVEGFIETPADDDSSVGDKYLSDHLQALLQVKKQPREDREFLYIRKIGAPAEYSLRPCEATGIWDDCVLYYVVFKQIGD